GLAHLSSAGNAEHKSFSLLEALRGVCDQAHDVLGWKISLLLLNDESTGLSCLVSAAGIDEDLKEVILGAGVGATEEIYAWLESGQLLARLANRIYRLRDPDEILEVTVHDVRDHLEADRCAVTRIVREGLEVVEQSCRPGIAPIAVEALPALEERLAFAREHG